MATPGSDEDGGSEYRRRVEADFAEKCRVLALDDTSDDAVTRVLADIEYTAMVSTPGSVAPRVMQALGSTVPALLRLADRRRDTSIVEVALRILALGAARGMRDRVDAVVRELIAHEPAEASDWVRSLGHAGFGVADFLDHPDAATRLAAALATEGEAATAEIAAQLGSGHGADVFPSATYLVVELVRRGERFDERAHHVVHDLLHSTNRFTPVGALAVAFAVAWDGNAALRPAQQAVLQAIAARDLYWDVRCVDVSTAFARAGVPRDRALLTALAETGRLSH